MATIGTAPAPRRSDGYVACAAGSFDGDRLVAPAKALRLLEALGRGLDELDRLTWTTPDELTSSRPTGRR
jgi:hypothetical protein